VTPPTALVIAVADVRDDHLRAANGDAEDSYVERLIRSGTRMAERETQRSLLLQTIELALEGFPGGGEIRLPRPPIVVVDSITYTDPDGAEQTLDEDLYVLRETGRDLNREGLIERAYDTTWPETRCHPGAVVVTYQAGYVTSGSPQDADVPDDIVHGVQLVVGEFYKQRSESVHTMNQNPALIRARDLWRGYTVY
jgi:uncharacterized phiE125 gp8 family phage protein